MCDWLLRSTYWGPLTTVAATAGVWINRASKTWETVDGVAVVVALLFWPIIEATVHKYMLHSRFPVFSDNHRNHHHTATIKNGLTPAIVGIFFGAVGFAIANRPIASTVFGTYLACYLVYEVVHTLVHCGVKIPILADHHLEHHRRPRTNYGVTTPWGGI